ncbi:hypothetical protein [Cereibacter azotoformans]|uniref:Uncharacterized protein n=1 Tax=Cereibacter azotoformans TaxID=43057 RepID=A0A2T5K702_9RHOB|nr:hypothetical protein [Cereibacter azotoformans]MBO4169528.1 hypothetical protein [Cereibacter azotoformans]PTR18205.1 hypothetical protein C8J28_109165 [Cereibacter azotoformans]
MTKMKAMTGDEVMAQCHEMLGLPLWDDERGGEGRRSWQSAAAKWLKVPPSVISSARADGAPQALADKIRGAVAGARFMVQCHEMLGLTMTAEQRTSGKGSHGWQVKAAERLGRSARAIRDAKDAGPSSVMLDDLQSALIGPSHARSVDVLSTEAGRWVVGEPETRKRGGRTEAEAVIMHMGSPSFIMYAEMQRGVRLETHYRIKWIDDAEKSDPETIRSLIATAMRKALDRITEQRVVAAEIKTRMKTIDMARRFGTDIPAEVIKAVPMLELACARHGATKAGLEAALDDIDATREYLDIEQEDLLQARWTDMIAALGSIDVDIEAIPSDKLRNIALVVDAAIKGAAHIGRDRGRLEYAANLTELGLSYMDGSKGELQYFAMLAAKKLRRRSVKEMAAGTEEQSTRLSVTKTALKAYAHVNTTRGQVEAPKTEKQLIDELYAYAQAEVDRLGIGLPKKPKPAA